MDKSAKFSPPFILRSLRHRNYRLFFFGQGVSLIGTWIQRIALNWLVYRLTGSATLLGIVGFAGLIPAFIFTPWAGVFVDRFEKRRIVMLTQIFSMVQAIAMAILIFTDYISVSLVIILSVVLGIINAIDMPARQSFVIEMVEEREDLSNAIALNSFLFNSSRLIGPTIAGILIAIFGEGLCFLINGLTYLAVIIALILMTLKKREITPKETSVGEELKESIIYVSKFHTIRDILVFVTVISIFGMSYITLMPVFAKDVLSGGPQTLGFLMGATGIGATLGALYLAQRSDVLGLARLIVFMSGLFGLSLLVFSLSQLFILSIIALIFTGLGMIVSMASCNTILQTIVDDDKRGRVMALYTMAFAGTLPFGSLLAGWLADLITAPFAVFVCGAVCLTGTAWFAHRSIYNRQEVSNILQKRTDVSIPHEEH